MGIFSYIPFLLRIIQNKIGKKNLFNITLDITDQCNSKCEICGIWKKHAKVDIDKDRFHELVQNSAILKKAELFSIGGGEPFFVPDLLKSIVYTINELAKPLQVRIVSNGLNSTTIYNTMKELLENTSLKFGLKLSLDGFGEIYEKIRGIKGGDLKVKQTIIDLLELKKTKKNSKRLDIEIGVTLTELNFSQLFKLFEFAQSQNIGFFYKPMIIGGRFKNSEFTSPDLKLNRSHYNSLIEFNQKLRIYIKKTGSIKERIVFKGFYSYYNSILQENRKDLKCGALKNSVYITPDLLVYPCLLAENPIGDLKKEEFDSLWKSQKAEEWRSEKKKCWCLTPCDTIPSILTDSFPFY